MGWLVKIGWDILGNKASLVFVGIMLVSLSTMAYNWKKNYDAKIVERTNAVHVRAELERESEAREIYQNEVSKMMDNKLKDEKAMAALKVYTDSQKALINEALKQLDQTAGGNCVIAANRQRLLFLTIKELETSADIPTDCEGTPSGCAVIRLRNAIHGKPEGINSVR